MPKTKLIINLFAGPGAGKSTAATYIFSVLKMRGYDCEYISEYAKDLVWQGKLDNFNCQFGITGRQAMMIYRLFNKVEIIVTDSPIALGSVYADSPELAQTCIIEFNKYSDVNYNVYLQRNADFKDNGRRHDQKTSLSYDKKIKGMLDYNGFSYIETVSRQSDLDLLIDKIGEEFRKRI